MDKQSNHQSPSNNHPQANTNNNTQSPLPVDLPTTNATNLPVHPQQEQQNDEQNWQSEEQGNESELSNMNAIIEQALQQLQQSASNQQQKSSEQLQQQQSSIQKPSQPQQPSYGCEHYLRNCQVLAPCCLLYYTCKLCHDQKYKGPKSLSCQTERMEFSKVEKIRCLRCKTQQQPSNKCVNQQCEITFGKYSCLKCKLYENRNSKVDDIFHCNECAMCRRGKVQNFFHCGPCGYCRHISEKNNHRCAQNMGESACPICLQILKYSVKHFSALPCGHLIHNECLSGYRDINCPVCGMAMQKISSRRNKQIDQVIEQTKANLPEEVKNKKVNVLCNQCLHKTQDAPFHFLGIKCEKCGTYNTKMI